MLTENREYWIRGDDGLEYGPVGKEELREWIQENRVGLETVVRPDEPEAIWQPWQAHPDLVALLAEMQAVEPGTLRSGQVAGSLVKRTLAFFLDVFLSGALCTPILAVLCAIYRPDLYAQFQHMTEDPNQLARTLFSETEQMCSVLIGNSMFILYLAWFHSRHGFTPGKALLRLRVVDERGEKPTLVTCLARGMMVVLSMQLLYIPVTYAFFNPYRRTFHDYISKTFVVEK